MPSIIVRHKVKDYDAWKAVFDDHTPTRREAGSKGGTVYRLTGDPSEVMIVLEWSDLRSAEEFIATKDLKETMERAGVIDEPDVWFIEPAAHTDA